MSLACHWTEKSVLGLLCLSVTLLEQVVLKISIICGFTQGRVLISPPSQWRYLLHVPFQTRPNKQESTFPGGSKQKANYVILGFLWFVFFLEGGGAVVVSCTRLLFLKLFIILCLAAAKGMTSMEAAAGFSQNQNWHFPSEQVKGEQKPLLRFLFSHSRVSWNPAASHWVTNGQR